MTTVSRTSLIDRVAGFLTAGGLAFSRHASEPLLVLRFVTDDGEWATFVDVRDDPPRLAIYSAYPEMVPLAARAAVAEVITRANYGMYVGNFEIDLDDGMVRFRTSLELADIELQAALFDRLLAINLEETKRHGRILARVAAGELPAREALRVLRGPESVA